MTSSEGYGSSFPPVTPAAGYPPYGPGGQTPVVPPAGFGPRDTDDLFDDGSTSSDLAGDGAPRAWDTTTEVPSWTPPPAEPPRWTPPPAADEKPSTTEAVKDEAASVAGGAAEAAKNVAGTAKEQVGEVVNEAKNQVRDLVGQARTELTDQAQVQQQRVAGGLHAVGDQLKAMAAGSDQPGVATDLAHQAAEKAHQVAEWLEGRDPGSVLDEVRSFARQRPGAFLALALGAGVVTGRLVRGLSADAGSSASAGSSGAQRTSSTTSTDHAALVAPNQVRPALPTTGTTYGTTAESFGEPIGWSEAR